MYLELYSSMELLDSEEPYSSYLMEQSSLFNSERSAGLGGEARYFQLFV